MRRDMKHIQRLGLIGGVIMAFVAGIGMVQTFDERILITPILSMGYLLLYGIPAVLGILTARGVPNPLIEPVRDPRAGGVSGAITGLIAGVVTAIFAVIVDSFDLTEYFPNMRSAMVEVMTFGLDLAPGLVVLIVASALAGASGGVIFGLSERVRKGLAIATAWILGFALFEVVVSDILSFADFLLDLIYGSRGGLEIYSAVIIGALAWWLSLRYEGRTKQFASQVRDADPKSRIRRSVIWIGILLVIVLPMMLGGIVNELLINVSLFILMGLGLNIVIGLAGLLDLGYVAFFAVGGYGAAVLTSTMASAIGPGFNWWLSLPVVMVFAALAGLFVGTPVLRMRGDYLAIVTLGFGEIVRILLLSDWLTPIFGGAQGIRRIPGIPVPFFGEISGIDPQLFIYFTSFFVGLAAYISYRAQNSRVGRAWAAMREDEDVAEAIGVSTVQSKLLAFITGAIIASFAGALFSAKVGTVFTNSFDVLVSIIILVVVIVGGMGSIPGVAVGAFVLIGILGGPKSPGLLQEFAEFKLLIYGALLVFMMLKRPEGLLPSARRSRELHQEEALQDAWLDKGGDFTDDEIAEPAT
jgi:branched-chain amino acid transport system permease protein